MRLFLNDRLDVNGGRGLEADAAQRVEGKYIRGVTRLHIGAAPSVEPVAFYDRLERWVRPHSGWSRRYDIHVGLQNERAPLLFAWPVNANHNWRARVLLGKSACSFVSLQRRFIHLEPVERIAAGAQCPKDKILYGMLCAAQ